ncbi:hypothetical protein Ancab_017421 [Ancistrocladus abbreviatus]
MVCQGASQTRFRALKHENGIPGKTTIIVRVIACFQPLQDCQAEYFRHLLKPVTRRRVYQIKVLSILVVIFSLMIEADSSWLCQPHSTLEPPNLNCMISPPEVRQHAFLPRINPCRILANVGVNGYGFSTLPERGPILEADGLLGQYVPASHTPLLTPNPFLNEKQVLLPTELDGKPPPSEVSPPQQKRYIIFDHSGNQTRLIGSLCSPNQHPTADVSTSLVAYNFPAQGHIVKAEQNCLDIPILQEELGENHMVIEGSDMHEDTDEIDALLYSDDDDDESHNDEENYDGEDGDEASTGHSPLTVKDKFEDQAEDITEEVASSNVFSKRRKALDGGYIKLSLLNTTKTVQTLGSYPRDSDADFRCSLREEMSPLKGSKQSRMDKIHDTLKILQTMVPSSKGKDPVVILDEAIDYLKCLKSEAEALFMEVPESF